MITVKKLTRLFCIVLCCFVLCLSSVSCNKIKYYRYTIHNLNQGDTIIKSYHFSDPFWGTQIDTLIVAQTRCEYVKYTNKYGYTHSDNLRVWMFDKNTTIEIHYKNPLQKSIN